MRILALDLGTYCGWAITPMESGVWDLSGRRFEGGGMRFVRFRGHLNEVLQVVDLVVYEEVRRHLGTDAAHIYGALQGMLTAECETRGIPYAAVPVAAIKRHATGKGNAGKEAMTDAARKRWPTVLDDDHADALWLLDYAQGQGWTAPSKVKTPPRSP